MPRLQLKINAAASEDCLATISTEFPDEEFRILASQTTADGLLGIVEVRMSDGEILIRHFEEFPEVRSSEVVYADERTVLLQYMIPVPDSYRVVRASENLVRFPVFMRDGWLFVERTASHERLAQYTDELEAAGMTYHILSLSQSYKPIELLTDRQRQFITEAVARGYYDTHRQCTLTELAETFAVTKSAASRILHRAEGRLIKNALPDSIASVDR